MKRIVLLLILLSTTLGLAQVGVNTTTPDPSSMLDVTATNKGALFPRVSLSNINLTTLDGTNTAATGLLIWNTNPATIGGNGIGYYYFNGTVWTPINQSASADADWYQVLTSTPSNNISNSIYTQGNVTIGNNSIGGSAKFNVFSNATSNSVRIDNSGTIGLENQGVLISNGSLAGPTTARYVGVLNSLSSSSGFAQTGFKNNFSNLSSNVIYNGVENDFPVSGTNGFQKGMRNYFGGGQSASGIENFFPIGATYSSITYGVTNSLSSQGNGAKYGVHNLISGSGLGFKYGTYNVIDPLAGGIHYGLYSEALKTGSYAGYFLGNVSVGTTTSNNYILPPSRGTNGQIMQTDGSGNLSWVNSPTDTDDQGTDVFSLTGNTLNLSIQNDGVATQIVDLSPLKDHDWYEVGGTLQPDAITDNKYTLGNVTIGSNTLATGIFDVDNSTKSISLDVTNSYTTSPTGIDVELNSVSSSKVGLNIDFKGTNTSSSSSFINNRDECATSSNFFGIYQAFIGSNTSTSNGTVGIRNWFATSSGYQGSITGTSNEIFNNLNGIHYGNLNYLTGTGIGAKYGTYNFIDNSAGGIHYGLYSEVLKAGSYAGYFLGRVSIGTTLANNYILPGGRGANGQIMQTDGSGNVTWVNPPTNTDNQGTDVFSLTGTTLNLSLQNDGVATQTVDLSSLKDADWYEVGGTNSPDAITDNKFTLGDISIGKTTAATAKVDIDAASKLFTLSLLNTNTNPGIKVGISNQLTMDDTNSATGIINGLNGNANFKTAIQNSLAGNYTLGSNTEYAINNFLQSTGNISTYGLNNIFSPSLTTSGGFYGVNNQINGNNHDGLFYGLRNITSNTTTSDQYGVYNNFTGGGSGIRYGVNNFYNGFMSGDVLGVNTFILGSGSGSKYGERIQITENSGGVHYGIYADVIKSNSYAGYFLGRVSVGTTIANNYILPPSRGLNGQIMQTDGAGNVSWTNTPTTTDADWFEVGGTNPANSILDNIYTGGDVSIGKATAATGKVDIEADNKTSTLVLENNNASTGAKYGILNYLVANSNNVTSSSIYNSISGNANFKSGINNVFSTNNTGTNIVETGVSNSFNFNGNVSAIGCSNFFNPLSSNSGDIIGYLNSVSDGITGYFIGLQNTNDINTNNTKTGLLNSFGGAGSGAVVGIKNELLSTTTGEQIGIDTNISSTGTGLKYGEKIEIDNTSGGLHFGVYADVTKANSFAGYFLGRVSLGTTIANNYILPSSRGTLGQIMVTNGTGDVSWVNPSVVFSDTDDQQIDVLSLTGDTLNISIQDDGVATQTLNLGAIDNQGTDVFSLTGNTLNLSLQNDGVPTQTVDLSTLANDWKLTGNAGTTSGTNFIGTTDAQDLSFRTNNITKLTLTQRGQLSITNTGGSVLVGSGAGDADDFTLNQNTFIGTVSGESTSSGNLNSALGFNSLNGNTLGLGNTAVGANALNANVDGNNNTGVGRGANVSTTNLTNATAVGFNSTVNAANKIRLGNVAITVVEGQVAYTNPSDARFKFNVQENVPGLDFIKKLKPVTYNFDTKKFDEHLNRNQNKDEVPNEDFATSTAIIRTGFLAQDVEKICTDLGYNFDGLHVPDPFNPTDNYGIAYSQFIMPIVKAVQEQQVIIESQKTELDQLKLELEKYKMLEERIKALEQK